MAKRARPVRIHTKTVKLLQKPACTTCRKVRAFLEGKGVHLEMRDLNKERLNASELDALIGDRNYRKFLNSRNELYRQRKMGQNPPERSEAIQLMASEPNLIRRPVVIRGGEVVLGFDEEGLKKLIR